MTNKSSLGGGDATSELLSIPAEPLSVRDPHPPTRSQRLSDPPQHIQVELNLWDTFVMG